MKLKVDLINDCGTQSIPNSIEIHDWVAKTLETINLTDPVSICFRLVSPREVAELNLRYRNKKSPTNILSFPSSLPESIQSVMPSQHLGDIVICPRLIQSEAKEQEKSERAHWAHLVVHGTLHLKGFTHETESESKNMEKEEIKVLEKLGFPNPYLIG